MTTRRPRGPSRPDLLLVADELLNQGATYREAAAAIGASPATVHRWVSLGWIASSRNPVGRPRIGHPVVKEREKKEPRRATSGAWRHATVAEFISQHPHATPSQVASAAGQSANVIRRWAREGHIPGMPNEMRVKRNKGLTRGDVAYCRTVEDRAVLTAALRDIPMWLVADAFGCTVQAVGQRLKRIAERRDRGRSS